VVLIKVCLRFVSSYSSRCVDKLFCHDENMQAATDADSDDLDINEEEIEENTGRIRGERDSK